MVRTLTQAGGCVPCPRVPRQAWPLSVVPHRPLRIAHRGASREFRENTLPAFARALALGADAIELDVHVTRDGIPVVHHDFDVHAGGGTAIPIIGATLDELREVDLGGGTRIPTLAEVARVVGSSAELLVELKGHGVEEGVVTCLARHTGPWALHSFDHIAIERVAVRWPSLRRGLLFDRTPEDLPGSVARAAALDVWPRGDLATPQFVEAAHALGLRVIAWTVNDPADGALLMERGVDGICTDDVSWLPAPG